MSKSFRSRNVAMVISAMTLTPALEASAMAWAIGDQDGMQDPDWMCAPSPDCNRVVDPQIEPGQDEQMKPEKVVDPHFKLEREPDTRRVIDPDIDPVEGPEQERVIDPPAKIERTASEPEQVQ